MSEYYIIDFGVNFANNTRYPDEKVKSIMEQSWNDGVEKIVCISNSIKESKRIIKMKDKFENMYYTLGVHPHNAKDFKFSDIDFIKTYQKDPKFFAIGECGLDYNRMFSPKDAQIYAFEEQIKLSKELNKKMYLHCRDAYDDFIHIIKKHNYYNGLIHCFTGNVTQALEFTKLGFKLGITGWLLDKRRNKDLQDVVYHPEITIDMLVVETDAPFMPIYPKKESLSSDLWHVLEEIANLKKLDKHSVGAKIYDNSVKFLHP
jgi:TatD DNase family protein